MKMLHYEGELTPKASLTLSDSLFLRYLRGLSIFVIVFGHVGGFWILEPYSNFLGVFIAIFFFISGAVSYYSFTRSRTIYEYYKKRLVGLLLPYYLLCILSLLVYLFVNHKLPVFSYHNLLAWLLIKPANEIMPFPVGQIWFLHVLLIIIILSPLYFWLLRTQKRLLLIMLCSFIFISFLETKNDISIYFDILMFNLYKPIFYSIFFASGFLFFTNQNLIDRKLLLFISLTAIIFSVILVVLLELNVSFRYHTHPPDSYYFCGSLFSISALLLIKDKFLYLIQRYSMVLRTLDFLYVHTFSFFLLHTFSIYLSETIFATLLPTEKGIVYGIVKLTVVMLLTCILSVPFSKISSFLRATLLNALPA